MSYIGLDVGTSGCKCAIVSPDGTISQVASASYAFTSPKSGYVELDPNIVWQAVKSILKEIAPYAQDASSIAVSSIGETMAILDCHDNVLYNGIVYLDQRCQNILPKVKERISPFKLHKITGVSVNQMFTLNKFLWFRENVPGLLEKADKFFLFGDYITYMLSGERGIDPATASRTMFFDANTRQWSEEIADLFDIPIRDFSTVTPPGTRLGHLRPELAAELGLPRSLTVVTGLHDQGAATLGAGCLDTGEAMIGLGSTESTNCVMHKKYLNDDIIKHEIAFEPYVDDDHYMIISGNLTHGSCIEWFIRNFYEKDASGQFDYDLLYRNCPDSAGEVFFIPYLSRVNLMNPANHALGGFLGIDVTVTKPQMFRALLEGLCFETRECLNIFHNVGVTPKKLIAAGGTTKVDMYMQLRSDVINQPLFIGSSSQGGILGLSAVCAVSDGDFASYKDAAAAFSSIKKTYYPQKNYEREYQKYHMIVEQVKALYDTLNDFDTQIL